MALKAAAQQNVKTGALRQDCPLIKFIVETNGLQVTGDNIVKVMQQLERMPDRKEILQLAYSTLFKEEVPDPKKNTSIKEMFLMDDSDFSSFVKQYKKG